MAELPKTTEEKLTFLNSAARHGDRIQALARPGETATELRRYVDQQEDLAMREEPSRITILYADLVWWEVHVDGADVIRGMGSSGYGPLMEALGIDFSGNPFLMGNGN